MGCLKAELCILLDFYLESGKLLIPGSSAASALLGDVALICGVFYDSTRG
ncbi:MAG: hypothetical protein ACD_17C00382G0003 [uncultured bacterium]|nr:MAG: hypothetical protein ACD_17C00382G0003 [uncultured bacterium]